MSIWIKVESVTKKFALARLEHSGIRWDTAPLRTAPPGQSPGCAEDFVPAEDFSATPLLRCADGWIKVEPPGQSPGGVPAVRL
jgi:hypothetical protein